MERIVHVCNGDSTADTLSLADLPGEIRVWADALDQGPLLPVSDAEELILWFEHDLFDQLALARLLARLARRGLPQQLTIVSIDRHPEVPSFVGLAQLRPEQ